MCIFPIVVIYVNNTKHAHIFKVDPFSTSKPLIYRHIIKKVEQLSFQLVKLQKNQINSISKGQIPVCFMQSIGKFLCSHT